MRAVCRLTWTGSPQRAHGVASGTPWHMPDHSHRSASRGLAQRRERLPRRRGAHKPRRGLVEPQWLRHAHVGGPGTPTGRHGAAGHNVRNVCQGGADRRGHSGCVTLTWAAPTHPAAQASLKVASTRSTACVEGCPKTQQTASALSTRAPANRRQPTVADIVGMTSAAVLRRTAVASTRTMMMLPP